MSATKKPILGETQDYFTPDAGTVDGPVQCGVCGDDMTLLARDSRGPRGFVQAMGMRLRNETNTGSPHDIFACPNREEDWHRQVVALRNEARRTSSGNLEGLLMDEAAAIAKSRQATKKVSPFA